MPRPPKFMTLGILAAALGALVVTGCGSTSSGSSASSAKGAKDFTVAYITPALDVPFWKWTSDGVHEAASKVGAKVTDYDSGNDGSKQLQNAQDAITKHVDAIVISPTDSSTTPAVLNAAKAAGIPVVIAFIGTSSGSNYVAYLTSTDKQGAFQATHYLTQQIDKRGWRNASLGTVTIPLARINGRERLAGFKNAVSQAGDKVAAQLEFKTDTIDEDASLVQDIVTAHPDMHGFFCQSDDCTLAAVQTLKRRGLLNKSVLLSGFDASPHTVSLIKQGQVMSASVQQPVTVGRKSFEIVYDKAVNGKDPAQKNLTVPIILVTKDNVGTTAGKLQGTAYPKGTK
jgi:ABC-type sugar transport system substrate-binding protein